MWITSVLVTELKRTELNRLAIGMAIRAVVRFHFLSPRLLLRPATSHFNVHGYWHVHLSIDAISELRTVRPYRISSLGGPTTRP
jgi:hypothetical protein